MDDEVLAAGERALRPRWPGVRLSDPQVLDGSDRSRVLRCRVAGIDGVATVVVKAHLSGEDALPQERESAVREPAALSLLAGQPGFVQLLGVAEQPPTLVMADVGAPGDLADRLLGSDPAAAADAVTAWAVAIAQLHSATTGFAPELQRRLGQHAERLARETPAAEATPLMLDRAANLLAEQAPRLGVHPAKAALDELRDLEDLLGGGPGARALTPSDACPDNNALTAAGAVLLDFESAQVRHIAWDAAYLTVPWPTCWCSWRLADMAARQALAAYRATVQIPHARTAAFDEDLRAAAAGWALVSTSWFLERAVEEDHTHSTHGAVMPQRRAMVSHRLAHVDEPRLPALTALAAELLDAAKAAWGDVPLDLAPAFRR